MKKILRFAFVCISMMAAYVSEAEELALPLKLKDNVFSAYSMEYSDDRGKICIVGNDSDESGSSSGRMIMIDLVRKVVMWQKEISVPDGYAGLFPVQCKVADDRVYMLADVDTKSAQAITQTLTYVYSFDFNGKELAKQKLKHPARSQYGYAIGFTQGGLKVAGYLKDEDDQFEYYSTFTTMLNKDLQSQGEPVVRKNGAYTDFVGARIIGEDIYLAGTFAANKVDKKKLISDFSGSRLRLEGSYVWSTHTSFNPREGVATMVAGDGSIYSLGFEKTSSVMLMIAPSGKASPLTVYPSQYCRTSSLSQYGKKLLSVRKGCNDSKNALLEIDPLSGKETPLHLISDEPLIAATAAAAWSVLARNKEGNIYFYSSGSGGK